MSDCLTIFFVTLEGVWRASNDLFDSSFPAKALRWRRRILAL